MTEQQKRFADAWINNGFNAKQAALDAGYSPQTAYSQGSRLLNHVEVGPYINDLLKQRKDNVELERQRWLAALKAIAYGELGEFVDIGTGKLKPEAQIPEDIRLAIEKLEYDQKGRAKVGVASKNKALELLGRHFAFLKEDDKTGVTIVFQQSEKDGLV